MKRVAFTITKVVVAMFVVTVIMMLLLAFLMLKMDLGENVARMFIVVIYIISTFVGGMIAGKVMNEKKYLWGTAVGVLYFAVLVILALAVKNSPDVEGIHLIMTAVTCCLGGMTGGMAA